MKVLKLVIPYLKGIDLLNLTSTCKYLYKKRQNINIEDSGTRTWKMFRLGHYRYLYNRIRKEPLDRYNLIILAKFFDEYPNFYYNILNKKSTYISHKDSTIFVAICGTYFSRSYGPHYPCVNVGYKAKHGLCLDVDSVINYVDVCCTTGNFKGLKDMFESISKVRSFDLFLLATMEIEARLCIKYPDLYTSHILEETSDFEIFYPRQYSKLKHYILSLRACKEYKTKNPLVWIEQVKFHVRNAKCGDNQSLHQLMIMSLYDKGINL